MIDQDLSCLHFVVVFLPAGAARQYEPAHVTKARHLVHMQDHAPEGTWRLRPNMQQRCTTLQSLGP